MLAWQDRTAGLKCVLLNVKFESPKAKLVYKTEYNFLVHTKEFNEPH